MGRRSQPETAGTWLALLLMLAVVASFDAAFAVDASLPRRQELRSVEVVDRRHGLVRHVLRFEDGGRSVLQRQGNRNPGR